MNVLEKSSHILIRRLCYLLNRLENEFFHVHPSVEQNGHTTSLAFTSILNEALILHEAAINSDNFWSEIITWGNSQDWKWDEIQIRFTYWPELSVFKPFSIDSKGKLKIIGRDENNSTKHQGTLASLESVLGACSAAWFLVMEKARESKVYLGGNESSDLMKMFDCFELITIRESTYGFMVSKPIPSIIEYPSVRGASEISNAKEAYIIRYEKWKSGKKA